MLGVFAVTQHFILSSLASCGKGPEKRKFGGGIPYIIEPSKGYCDIVIYNKNIYIFGLHPHF